MRCKKSLHVSVFGQFFSSFFFLHLSICFIILQRSSFLFSLFLVSVYSLCPLVFLLPLCFRICPCLICFVLQSHVCSQSCVCLTFDVQSVFLFPSSLAMGLSSVIFCSHLSLCLIFPDLFSSVFPDVLISSILVCLPFPLSSPPVLIC